MLIVQLKFYYSWLMLMQMYWKTKPTYWPINYAFEVVVWPIMQRTKPGDNIFIRQNDDHLPMCTVVEINIGYYAVIHYLNSFVWFKLPIQVSSQVHISFWILHPVLNVTFWFKLWLARSLDRPWLEESIHIIIPRSHTCLSHMPIVVNIK